jgi:WD40 repeat protein
MVTATLAGREISVWDFGGEKPKRMTQGVVTGDYPKYITTDGKFMVALIENAPEGTARLWRIAADTLTKVDEVKDVSNGMTGSPDGKLIVFRNGGLFDISEGKFKPVVSFPGSPDRVSSPAFSPDGKWIAFCGPRLEVFDWKTKDRVYSWDAPGYGVLKVEFAPDGRHLVTLNKNGTMYVIRLAPPPK